MPPSPESAHGPAVTDCHTPLSSLPLASSTPRTLPRLNATETLGKHVHFQDAALASSLRSECVYSASEARSGSTQITSGTGSSRSFVFNPAYQLSDSDNHSRAAKRIVTRSCESQWNPPFDITSSRRLLDMPESEEMLGRGKRVAKEVSKPSTSRKKSKTKPPIDQVTNEGVDPNRDYHPPAGYSLIQSGDDDDDGGEFDWDAVAKAENKEIWLIRVPESLKPKYIDGLTLELPPAPVTALVGTLPRKHATYDIWTMGDEPSKTNPAAAVGGEEIKALSCLFPRKKKKGKFYSVPIARHLVFTAQSPLLEPAGPSVDLFTSSSTAPQKCAITGPFKRPPRENYPPEALKHRFMPYGSLNRVDDDDDDDDENAVMDIDEQPPPPNQAQLKQRPPEQQKGTVVAEVGHVEVEGVVPQQPANPEIKGKRAKGKRAKEKEKKEKDEEKAKEKGNKGRGGEETPKQKGKKRKGDHHTPMATVKKTKLSAP